MHYSNIATNCAFDIHREGEREGEGGASFCQGVFQPARITLLKSSAELNLCASQSSARYSSNQIPLSYNSKIKIYCLAYVKITVCNTLFYHYYK